MITMQNNEYCKQRMLTMYDMTDNYCIKYITSMLHTHYETVPPGQYFPTVYFCYEP